ncbi:MAG TPA: hypothetical protein VHZ50_18765 [Puia sp.]|nr:hypothetical protein [Puia sp.]
MIKLEDKVMQTVEDFIENGKLFTALDVSNAVKIDLPFSRHREIRDEVRKLFISYMEPLGYAKTPIEVVLDDGQKVEALLYHSLVDSWDLDSKYDSQKRSQTTTHSNNQPAAAVLPVSVPKANLTASISINHPVVIAKPVPINIPAHIQWDNLFKSQPSLFPRS